MINPSSSPERKRQEPLTGTEEALCDKKGRIMIGKKNRERIGESFAMAINEIGCLVVYPQLVWERMVDEIEQYPMMNAGRIDFARLLNSDAEDQLEFDGQGRVVIPHALRTRAGIEMGTQVLLVGSGHRLEVWPLREYEIFLANKDAYNRDRRVQFKTAYDEMVGASR